MTSNNRHYVLTLSCPDKMGIMSVVTTYLNDQACFVEESSNYGDPNSKMFFMHVRFKATMKGFNEALFAKDFEPIAQSLDLTWKLSDLNRPRKVLIMVSKFDHCLNDLLHRYRTGDMLMEIPAVVSNHPDLRSLVEWHGIPFHHIPVTKQTKAEAEKQLDKLIEDSGADTIVLARYMQILSEEMCAKYSGQIINIHHSALPSFKGARPYHRAFDRGVKITGATAHYVTEDLDEGPIIEQQMTRVEHFHSANDLVAKGRDVECMTLSNALRHHLQHRVFLNQGKTVVFRR